MKNNPLVSISCITYNHAPYIRECLDGFMMQKTNFAFEVLIHDDASTDGTIDIIKEYEAKYPEVIKPIIQKENQYSQGKRGLNSKYNFSRAKGKYIALCDGDDYWTDPLKLQKQVAFLEENEDCSMVFTNAEVLIDAKDAGKSNNIRGLTSFQKSKYFTAIEILDVWTVPTASVIFRAKCLSEEYYKLASNKSFMFGDIVLFQYLASKGKLFGMEDFTVVYRRHSNGATNFSKIKGYDLKHLKHLEVLISIFGKELKTKKIKKMMAQLALSVSLNNIKKYRFVHGVKYFFVSLANDRKVFQQYFLKRIL